MAKSAYQIVQAKAAKYRVPVSVLWGVYGVETAHGSDVNTSSAGAKGAFQFIESTAHSYNYPYTNAQTQPIFEAQADSAAHYLSDLVHQTGSWDAALQHYSGGGYGWKEVAEHSGAPERRDVFSWPWETESPSQHAESESLIPEKEIDKELGLEHIKEGLKGIGKTVQGTLEAGPIIVEWLGDPLRLVKLIGGGSLVLMGIWTLTKPGDRTPPVKAAEGAAAVVGVEALSAKAAGRAVRRRRMNKPKRKGKGKPKAKPKTEAPAAKPRPSAATATKKRTMRRPAESKPAPAPKPQRKVILPPGVEA